jgi:membrane protease YdiL (CAAX protease family)
VISEKPWRAELVLLLGAGLLIVLMTAILGSALINGRDASPNFPAFFFSTMMQQVLTVVLIHVFLKLHHISWREFLGIRRSQLPTICLFALGVAIVAFPVTMTLNHLAIQVITVIDQSPAQQLPVQVLEKTQDPAQRAVFALAAIVMAPLWEESIFRGILYPRLKHHGHPRLALWATSLMFAAIHFHLATFIPLFVFGVMLVWIYERTDSLLAPILTHAAFNAINFLLFINQSQVEQWLKKFQ